MFAAFALYSLGVWVVVLTRHLQPWHAGLFWAGFIFDFAGTELMRRLAGGFQWSLHTATGAAALFEQGTTGIRDALVADEALADGRLTIDPEAKKLRGWTQDPYDPTLQNGFHRNLSEAEEYDAWFPTHPLSRLRPLLAQVQRTVQIEDEVRRSAPFAPHL